MRRGYSALPYSKEDVPAWLLWQPFVRQLSWLSTDDKIQVYRQIAEEALLLSGHLTREIDGRCHGWQPKGDLSSDWPHDVQIAWRDLKTKLPKNPQQKRHIIRLVAEEALLMSKVFRPQAAFNSWGRQYTNVAR